MSSAPARRPVGRPPDPERQERRRQDLIASAYAVIAERGYAAAGVAEIAERAGIAPATFYRYFESKRQIADAVLEYGVESAIASLRGDSPPEAATSLDEFDAQLRAIGARAMDLFEREPALARMLLFEIPSIDERARRRANDLVDRWVAFVAAYIEHGVEQGYLRDDLDTQAVSAGALALVAPALIDAMRGAVPGPSRAGYVDTMVDVLLAGIRA